MEQFSVYDEIFTPVFLQYNGRTQTISLQYKLRTYSSFMDKKDFIKNLLNQYLENPIYIPSELYQVQIISQNSLENLASNPEYFNKIGNFSILNLSNLLNVDSQFIDITIYSNFQLDLESLISTQVSRQPKMVGKNQKKYQITSILKYNQFPEKFQCLNIPISFTIILNEFIAFFIPKKFLIASFEWYKMETSRIRNIAKENRLKQMIYNRYKVTPLKFNEIFGRIMSDILEYIKINYKDVIKIENINGHITPKAPRGIYEVQPTGLEKKIIELNFETSYDDRNVATQSNIIFNFNWMRKIFKNYLPV